MCCVVQLSDKAGLRIQVVETAAAQVDHGIVSPDVGTRGSSAQADAMRLVDPDFLRIIRRFAKGATST